ncbi:MAG TPA: NADH-quinone oxidoreductase subunit C [Gammaproteobacteria bacterium]|jgi:NADH-quinone oxidoreductase subunit C|nr:NADH-quinone oxidoreductase subunit C [Gammaproteobacteria bacterium]
MTDIQVLCNKINEQFADWIESTKVEFGEATVDVLPQYLLEFCRVMHDDPAFKFNMLIDVCGVDYLYYGLDDWQTQSATGSGFSRGVTEKPLRAAAAHPTRFAVVYHLLSLEKNHRLRLRVNLRDEHSLLVDSVMSIWPAADWFEREAFDLYGIMFKGHPDLRRLLTDYGFSGHPFRKDFPLIGKVEARYDAGLKRVIYEPVSIDMRILEPKVIRHDHRYEVEPLNSESKNRSAS